MSSHSQLYISDYPILFATNDFYRGITSLIFTKEDFVKEKRKNKETFKGFQQKVKFCKQRLELIGCNLKRSKKKFNRSKNDTVYEDSTIENMSFEDYTNELKEIIEDKSLNINKDHKAIKNYLPDTLIFSDKEGIDFFYILLTVVDDENWVSYDLTEIIEDGWISNRVEEIIENDKIIILTEGKTDTEFIQKSIELLYPQLYGFFHFMDFPLYNLEGSASHLLKILKALIAANIKNKIIALFDNDAAASNELILLKNITIPKNFKILQYPKIKLASKYPTVGPSGRKTMNVNGLAGSIEMYLGEELLKENNKFIPVYWKGYQEKSKKYQGEIDKKKEIQNKFRDKIKNFNPDKIDANEWENMNLILDLIFKAFAK